MRFRIKEKTIRIATICAVIYLLCFGIAMAFFPIRPFWNDEWRLMYNIKFKDFAQLWGRLDLLQECPRAYLSILKLVGAAFDYSYTSLRIPALIITVANLFFLFRLRKKVYPDNSVFSYLFILILVSSQTFTDYMTQVKHYETDIFFGLLAFWQLITLLEIKQGIRSRTKYFLLCASCLIPYFSYVYPIAIAPVYPVVLLFLISRQNPESLSRRSFNWYLIFPLILAAISIVVFYRIDVKNVMADERMYDSYLKVYFDGGKPTFIENFWYLFALVGSGLLYEIIFGILGILSFFYGIYKLVKARRHDLNMHDYLRLYAVLLLLLVLGLLVSGKIVGGVARLTVYTIPSIAFLILSFFEDLKRKFSSPKLANILAGILFIGLFGNIISTCINSFTYPEYANRIKTYWNTSKALKQARREHIPIMVTDGVCGDQYDIAATAPGRISTNTITPEQIAGVDTLCAEVIVKVNPEYKIWDTIPYYYMPDTKWMKEYMRQLPDSFNSAIAGDGIHFIKLRR